MNQHPIQLLEPVFRFLDRQIHENGDILYMLLVYFAVPFIAWFLGRRAGRKKVKRGHTFVLVVRSPVQAPEVPPVIRWNFDAPDEDSGPFGN